MSVTRASGGRSTLRAVLGRFRNLPRGRDVLAFVAAMRTTERTTVLRALRDGLVVSWTLRRRGVRPLLATENRRRLVTDAAKAERVSLAVDAGLAMLPLASTCLRRSLVLLIELRRLGLAGALHVGVRHTTGVTEAHAWVQVGERVVNDDPSLTATYSQIAAGDLESLLPLLSES